MPQGELQELLRRIGVEEAVGVDCSIVPTRHHGLVQVSTTDFFFPLVEDPVLQGRITAANVLSDMYALGVVDVDNVLMLLGACRDMTPEERTIVSSGLMRGFTDAVEAAGSRVTGGQTTQNGWPLVGGVAMSCCSEAEIVRPVGARPGDVLVLTKPLGTQLAGNLYQWRRTNVAQCEQLAANGVCSREDAMRAFDLAVASMCRLNRNGARAMHRHGAHCATDVTGFGILGHATNLAAHQTEKVDFVLRALPVIARMHAVNAVRNFKLTEGRSAETSGGLLVALPADRVDAFIADLREADGTNTWVVGEVVAGSGTARMADDLEWIEVTEL